MYKVCSYFCMEINRHIRGLRVLVIFFLLECFFVLVCVLVGLCSCVCKSIYGGQVVIFHPFSTLSSETGSIADLGAH